MEVLRNTDYVNIFLGPNFVSPEWRCPLNRGAPNGEVPLHFIGNRLKVKLGITVESTIQF